MNTVSTGYCAWAACGAQRCTTKSHLGPNFSSRSGGVSAGLKVGPTGFRFYMPLKHEKRPGAAGKDVAGVPKASSESETASALLMHVAPIVLVGRLLFVRAQAPCVDGFPKVSEGFRKGFR